VRVFEWISLAYFVTLATAALIRSLPSATRVFVIGTAASTSAAILLTGRFAGNDVRSALPFAVILAGYFLSGSFAIEPSVAFERWLLSWDERWLEDPATRFVQWPRPLLAALEIVYIGCFLLVPAGVGALRVTHAPQPLIDRYWSMVTAAEFGSFVSLAFVYARPPWVLEQRVALPDRAVHRAGTRFVQRLTIRANTFPSGHAAGSLAVALGIIGPLPAVGIVLLALAVAICAAAVIGRYHYAVDVVAGIGLALVIFAILR